jgi:hypothetical protein
MRKIWVTKPIETNTGNQTGGGKFSLRKTIKIKTNPTTTSKANKRSFFNETQGLFDFLII